VITTEATSITVPKAMIEQAHETWPETRDMTLARTLRFALAFALTDGDRSRAIEATRDARIGTKRTTKIE
jgi:hypothetical protein